MLESDQYYRFYADGGSYRYGMNGQEKDLEIAEGVYTAEFWEYDSRLARRWNTDPVVKYSQSRYCTFDNNPILLIDPSGRVAELPQAGTHTIKDQHEITVQYNKDGSHTIQETRSTIVQQIDQDGTYAVDITETSKTSTTTITVDASGNTTSFSSTVATSTSYSRNYKDPCTGGTTLVNQTGDHSMDGTTMVNSTGAAAAVSLETRGSIELQNYVAAVSNYVKDPNSKFDSPIQAAAEASKEDAGDILLYTGTAISEGIGGAAGMSAGAVIGAISSVNDQLVDSKIHDPWTFYRSNRFGIVVGEQDPTLNPNWWQNGDRPTPQ